MKCGGKYPVMLVCNGKLLSISDNKKNACQLTIICWFLRKVLEGPKPSAKYFKTFLRIILSLSTPADQRADAGCEILNREEVVRVHSRMFFLLASW